MNTYDTFDSFWNDYFSLGQSQRGLDEWVIGRFTHTPDAEYAAARADGKDSLGFQPLLLSLANPMKRQVEDVVIKHVTDAQFQHFKSQHLERFRDQFENRFGLFFPQKNSGSVEYANWQLFQDFWVETDGKNVLPYNIPLLFDHPTNVEYWSWQQKGDAVLNYQRLIVTVYQPRKNRLHDLFIRGIDESEMQRIKLLLRSKVGLGLEELFV